jgi:hypothetical protein
MTHHTASGAASDGWPDVDYICDGSPDAPLSNLYLGRNGTIYICAAGATNTNGKGSDPCGVTPDDSMNSSAIGIEAGNNGIGETWPTIQQDAYIALCWFLCAEYDIPTGRVHAHFEWAPSRKIDPAGNSRYASGGASWNMDAFRGDTALYGHGGTPPPPGGDMTSDQARQLAELHAALVTPMPGNTDPNGIEMGVNWTTVYGYRLGQDIQRRLWAIEDALNIPHT